MSQKGGPEAQVLSSGPFFTWSFLSPNSMHTLGPKSQAQIILPHEPSVYGEILCFGRVSNSWSLILTVLRSSTGRREGEG